MSKIVEDKLKTAKDTDVAIVQWTNKDAQGIVLVGWIGRKSDGSFRQ